MQIRASVKPTERDAATMPLMRIMSSGIDRSMRARRVRRIRRKIRRSDALPGMPPPPAPCERRIRLTTQVSMTMRKTRMVSKTNQPSRMPSRFRLKAQNRTNHSKEK